MAMILVSITNKLSAELTHFVNEEEIKVLGLKGEFQKLQQLIVRIQTLLNDAEKKINYDPSIHHWLSELKDVMYDTEDIIDISRIKRIQMLAGQNPDSKKSPVGCNFSSAFSCFTSDPRHPSRSEIRNSIKKLNDRLNRLYENGKELELEEPEIPGITLVDTRQTSSMVDDVVAGREVEVAANELVEHLIAEKVEKKFCIFAVTGMGGIGKTTLAQTIFNHPKIQTYFTIKVWVCVSQTYSETELLKEVIRGAKGSYGDAESKSELKKHLESVVSAKNIFLVLDDVWCADVWVNLLKTPLYHANTSVRVLVTTRFEDVAKYMYASKIHPVMNLSLESSWDMLRRRLFSEGQEEIANGLKELGFQIVGRCGGFPLAIKAIAGFLARKERSRKEWENFLLNQPSS